jgi:hypothetical protein
MKPYVAIAAAVAALASAQAHAAGRTFVSGQGLDTNPCSLAAPCRTLAAALAATSSGGEIIVLTTAGYGPVTIGQSVAIIAPPGVTAYIPASGGPAITVNGSGISVVLEGLDIDLFGGATGILFQNGATLSLDRIEINGSGGSGGGNNIQHNAANGVLTMANSVLRRGGNCFVAQSSSPSSPALTTIVNSRAEGCYMGFVAQANSVVSISQTVAAGTSPTSISICYADFAALGTGVLGLDSVVATNCELGVGSGPINYPGIPTVTVSNSLVTGNETGVESYEDSSGPAKGFTYGNNRVFGNASNGGGFTLLTTQ